MVTKKAAAKKQAPKKQAPRDNGQGEELDLVDDPRFNKLLGLGTEIANERDKLTLQLGQFVIARLVGIREGTSKEKPAPGQPPEHYRIYDLDELDQETGEETYWFLLGGADLDAKLKGDLVGHVLAIQHAGEKDVGQISPMKVFRVVDLGDDFPDLTLPV